MNKTELVNEIAAKANITKKDAEAALNAALDAIAETLADGGKVTLANFGVFETKQRKARMARNPRTNAPIEIPAKSVCQFKPGKRLKDAAASK